MEKSFRSFSMEKPFWSSVEITLGLLWRWPSCPLCGRPFDLLCRRPSGPIMRTPSSLLEKHLQVFYGEDPLVFYVLFYYETTFGPSMEKIHWSSMSCTLGWSVEKALCSSMKRRSTGLPCRISSGLLWRRPSVLLWRRPYGNFRSFLREFLLFYMGRASGFLCKNRGSVLLYVKKSLCSSMAEEVLLHKEGRKEGRKSFNSSLAKEKELLCSSLLE